MVQEVVDRKTVVTEAEPGSGVVAARVISWVTSALLALLALRIVLSLLGANQGNAFAQFVYSLSYPFVAPFFGLFGYTMQYGVARFELETLVAMVVYGLVGYGLARLVSVRRRPADVV